MRHIHKLLLLLCLTWGAAVASGAQPLTKSDLPEPLKSWVPWVLHGHEVLACPAPYNGGAERACVWPSRLELKATRTGAEFRFEVQVFGAPALVDLPGEPGKWPLALTSNGRPLAVSSRGERPVALLAPGSHVVSGSLRWQAMPEDLALPRETGGLQLSLDGRVVKRVPDADGRVWLQGSKDQAQAADALTVRTARLVDDAIPLRVTTHYDLAVSGRAREVQLPMALLPGFVAESLDSPLPARLQEHGQLRVQVRPGNWTLELRGHLLAPTNALTLPQGLGDEIWSVKAHNELRVVNAEGLASIDPKQVPIPERWRAYPAFQIKPGQTLKLVESRRGNPLPVADHLKLERQIWLDFDGKGYTMQDAITGKLSRAWRLEMAPPAVLGRVATEQSDQPVTRRATAQADGIELRRAVLAMSADSRLEGDSRTLPASGWLADFNAASADLHLPPGWGLLHASGVDQASDSWVERWTLWDFFVVLLSTLATAKLLGPRAAALMAMALIASAHMPWAPRDAWLVLLALLALSRVLAPGKLLGWATWGARLCAGVIALLLLPHAVQQFRLSIYPALEYPWQQVADGQRPRHMPGGNMAQTPMAAPPPAPAPAAAGYDEAAPMRSAVESVVIAEDIPPPPAAAKPKSPSADRMLGSLSKTNPAVGNMSGRYASAALGEIDPNAKVQTGPGLPTWQWNAHHLAWQGPVQATQNLSLYLLPPAGTVALRLVGLALLLALFWTLVRALPGWPRRPGPPLDSPSARPMTGPMSAPVSVPVSDSVGLPVSAPSTSPPGSAMALVFAAVLALLSTLAPTDGWAASPAPPGPGAQVEQLPNAALLAELRSKLSVAPTCMPHCADIARLRIEAQGSQVQLRLEVHAQADTMLPLPGQGSNWRPSRITSDGKPAVLRRDASGALWIAVHAGVVQVVLAADVGEASKVEIALPMPAREVSVQAPGWTLNGLDARGLSSGALSLSRSAVGAGQSVEGTQRDGLPAFVQVQRTVRLGLRWTVDTQVTRLTPSRAPVRVKIRLLAGESVNNETVRVEDGFALVQLGVEDAASFGSTLKEAARLQLTSGNEANLIEVWRLEPSPQWHVAWSGIAPVHYVDRDQGHLMPRWQPWPGESVTLDISKPLGSAGQTLTIDQQTISLTPGLRATDVTASATLRSSQGGNHRVQLPEGIEFLGLFVDGASQPIQPQGRELMIPINPGQHAVKIDWREPRGIGWWFESTPQALGAAGVNASTEIRLGSERVVLGVGGPRVGPAVLFWGVLLALLGVALALGQTRLTPLGAGAWFLLGIGLAQTSLWGAATVVAFFFALAARRLAAPVALAQARRLGRVGFNLFQVVLLLWALVCVGIVFDAVQTGLLGHPDMMIIGNGSTTEHLRWYQERFAGQPDTTWVVSMPVLAYRLLMLLWALWLAASMVKWTKWVWESFSLGGYWRKPAPAANTEATSVQG